MLFHAFLTLGAADEKSRVILIISAFVYELVFFCSAFGIIYFVFFDILAIIFCGELLLCSCLFGVLQASSVWMPTSFCRFGEFSAIVSLNNLSFYLIFTSAPPFIQ